MGGITLANAIILALTNLGDNTTTPVIFTNCTALVAQVANEISTAHPLAKRTNLAIVPNTWDVDLSTLAFSGIKEVYYPADSQEIRQFNEYGTTLNILMFDNPPTLVSGTLTGTVVFTQNSRSVTGTDTLFLTELQVGHLVCVGKVASAAFKYYRVAYITDDTHLTLAEVFEEANNTDTVNLTKYRTPASCVSIKYGGNYAVSTTSDMPARFDDLLVLGVVAHASNEFAADQAVDKLVDVTSKIVSATTQAGLATARLSQAVTDLASGRSNFNTSAITTAMAAFDAAMVLIASDLATGRTNLNSSAITTAMAAVDAAMSQILTDLTASRANIGTGAADLALADTALDKAVTDLAAGLAFANTVNLGGDVVGKYIETAKGDISTGLAWIEKAKTYLQPALSLGVAQTGVEDIKAILEKVKTYISYPTPSIDSARVGMEEAKAIIEKVRAYIDENKPNIDIAVQEINTAAGYVNQAIGYMQLVDRDVAASQLISSYKSWAQMKWMEYQNGLRNIRPFRIHEFGSKV
jgi:hypothetical protein